MNASTMAYVGDAVFEVYARRACLYPVRKMNEYARAVVELVRAEAQSKMLATLVAGGALTDEEVRVVQWGRNGVGKQIPKRGKGNVERDVYEDATAMECLVGYLFVFDPERLVIVMDAVGLSLGGATAPPSDAGPS